MSSAGCTGGALLSALFLVFIVYRVVPKVGLEAFVHADAESVFDYFQKTIGIPILLGGWSAAAWMAVHAWNNFSSIMKQYERYVALYFVSYFDNILYTYL